MKDKLRRGSGQFGFPGSWSSGRGFKIKRFCKMLNNLKMTLLCSFVTILVLRGTIGLSSVGLSSLETNDLRQEFPAAGREASRVLSESTSKDAEPEEEEEPLPEIDSQEPYSLGPKISDWNEQRRAWLQENPELGSLVNGKPRILLVSGSPPKPCDNPVGDHYLLKAVKNKIDYCRLHNIDIFYNMAHLDAEMAGYWSKLPLLRKLMLAHPEAEWVWWMDSDAMFTDMVFELPLDRYKNHNFVLHGWDDEIYNKKNWVGLNTGSFLLRNCQWSLDMLDAWAPMGPKGKVREEAGVLLTEFFPGRPPFEADDQSALVYLLSTQRDLWGDMVYLENSYYLHGYWVNLVDKLEEMIEKYHPGYGDERWPFVTHFVGCKPCGSYGDYSVERCLKQMEKSFNFGDNQILQMYGFQHRSLGTFKVKRTRNDTSHPLDIQDDLNLLHPSLDRAISGKSSLTL